MQNISEQITTDGGPQMMSGVFPHSNNRAQTAMKSSKMMLQDSVSGSTEPVWTLPNQVRQDPFDGNKCGLLPFEKTQLNFS